MVAIEVPNSRPSVGRATLTMVASRTVMIAPSTTTAASVRISRVSTGASAGCCDSSCLTGSACRVAALVMAKVIAEQSFVMHEKSCNSIPTVTLRAMAGELGLRERKKQRTRQLLSETARRLFSERGFEQVSIAEIAREAEVSEQTVFNYFPSKEDLVYSGLEAFEERLL